MNDADLSAYWETYLAMREFAVIATCVLFFLCGGWWFILMNLITLSSISSTSSLATNAEYVWATLVADGGIAIVAVLAVLTYKRRFFLPLFLLAALTIYCYLMYQYVILPILGM